VIEPGDLLTLTSHGRGGVRRWLLGSVAEKLVREAKAPVMLVPAVERSEELRS
jgi:nucleotide-binding universal stress UspA family protein